ncbi:hypothetical protein DFH28DRAFT_1216022 [Melampsora americana]|nr:hypothetical protein DFH28DRAFT_1216022 [Melampsora americana]
MSMEPFLLMPMNNAIGSSGLPKVWAIVQYGQTIWKTYRIWISAVCVVGFISSYWLFLPSSKYEHQSESFQRASTVHMTNAEAKTMNELPMCTKTMLYRLEGIVGFGSELSLYTEAAAVASLLNYTMLLDDSKWNYGKLSDYFDITPLECRPPTNWREMPRTRFSNLGSKESDHVWATRDTPEGYNSYILQQVDPRAIDTHAVWNMINHREQRIILPAVQNLHHSLTPIFDAKSEGYRHIWRPNRLILDEVKKLKHEFNQKMLALQNKHSQSTSLAGSDSNSTIVRKMISVQFRMGDKIKENVGWKPAEIFGMKSAQSNPQPFFEVVRSYVPDWKTSKDLPALFVLSDDPEAALKKFDEHQSFYLASQRFPLVIPPRAISNITDHGHQQSTFNSAPLNVRRKLAIALIRDLTFAVENSESIVCSSSSNLCNLMFHLRGSEDLIGPTGSCRSVDVPWYPTGMPHSFNKLSLNWIKDREKILAMIPRLATDPRNYIDI